MIGLFLARWRIMRLRSAITSDDYDSVSRLVAKGVDLDGWKIPLPRNAFCVSCAGPGDACGAVAFAISNAASVKMVQHLLGLGAKVPRRNGVILGPAQLLRASDHGHDPSHGRLTRIEMNDLQHLLHSWEQSRTMLAQVQSTNPLVAPRTIRRL